MVDPTSSTVMVQRVPWRGTSICTASFSASLSSTFRSRLASRDCFVFYKKSKQFLLTHVIVRLPIWRKRCNPPS